MRRFRCTLPVLTALIVFAAALRPGAQVPPSSAPVAVDAHLNEFVDVLQREWLNRASFEWAGFRQRLLQRAAAAASIADAYPAMRAALAELGDRHTYYITASGEFIFNPASPTQSTNECEPTPVVPPLIPGDIGYVRIQITPQTPKEAIQRALRDGDGPQVRGWIVDLRNSRGGNMWPALAGIGSLLGDGTAGFFIDAGRNAVPWGYRDGEATLDGQRMDGVDMPYQPRAAAPRIAVLTDIGVASSGETIAIAFRGRPNTRSFGTPTCGLSTAVTPFRLANGARLAVVTAIMADRTMRQYGGVVQPDELVADPDLVVARAIDWLRGNNAQTRR